MTDVFVRRSRFPGYDVLAKRDTPSWDEVTRRVIDARLATPQSPRFLTDDEWRTADALCRRILPQDGDDDQVRLVALLDAKLYADHGAGFREADMPYMREAWRKGLAAIDTESKVRHGGSGFAALDDAAQDALIGMMQAGQLSGDAWQAMDPKAFFERRVLVDVPPLFYSLPKAWNEMGFGGPASPRGYVRLEGKRRDPWEAAESTDAADATDRADGDAAHALRLNRHVV